MRTSAWTTDGAFKKAKEAEFAGNPANDDVRKDVMRQFQSGATRDTDEGKFDYEGFLSPLVLREFARYMHEHRRQADGTFRDSDNWKKGIPKSAYMKSMFRHFMEVWLGYDKFINDEFVNTDDQIDALCALMFNVMGYLHEMLSDGEDCR